MCSHCLNHTAPDRGDSARHRPLAARSCSLRSKERTPSRLSYAPASTAANLTLLLSLAASLERAVTHAAELLLGAGVFLVLVWALVQRRIGFFRWPALALAVATLLIGTVVGGWAWYQKRDRSIRGSPTVEFVPAQKPKKRPQRQLLEEPWPMYGYDVQRTRAAPFKLRPPYAAASGTSERSRLSRRLRSLCTDASSCIDQHSAHVRRERSNRTHRLEAEVPDTAARLRLPSTKELSTSPSCTVFRAERTIQALAHSASSLRSMRRLAIPSWKFSAGAIQSSPLIVGHVLYFGSWDHHVYALDLRRKRNRVLWSYETDDKVVAAPAYANGTIFVGTNGGWVYALDARTGDFAGEPSRSLVLGSANTSTPHRRLHMGASSWATPMELFTPMGLEPAIFSGHVRSERTSTPRRRSGARLSSSEPGTATSALWTFGPETFAGATPPLEASWEPPLSSTGSV